MRYNTLILSPSRPQNSDGRFYSNVSRAWIIQWRENRYWKPSHMIPECGRYPLLWQRWNNCTMAWPGVERCSQGKWLVDSAWRSEQVVSASPRATLLHACNSRRTCCSQQRPSLRDDYLSTGVTCATTCCLRLQLLGPRAKLFRFWIEQYLSFELRYDRFSYWQIVPQPRMQGNYRSCQNKSCWYINEIYFWWDASFFWQR